MNTATGMEITPRQARIHELLQSSDFLAVDELAYQFEVTTQTIRRDLNGLCDLGLARRRHGGIEKQPSSGNLAYSARQAMNQAAKQAIAHSVAALVPNDASLSFGIGTTPAAVAQALLKHKRLRVFTNNLSIGLTATSNDGFEVHLAGGQVRNSDQDITGPSVEDFFACFKTDFGVFGVAGVDEDGCLLDFSVDEVRTRESIRSNCRQSLLVLDSSKFGRAAPVRGGWIYDASMVICDRRPPPAVESSLLKNGSTLIIANTRATP